MRAAIAADRDGGNSRCVRAGKAARENPRDDLIDPLRTQLD